MKKPWESFVGIKSETCVPDLVKAPLTIAADDLIDMQLWHKQKRMAACNNVDPVRVIVAYAQDYLIFDDNDTMVTAKDRATYLSLPRERKLNKFGRAYRRNARLYLHRTLADIITAAAIYLHQSEGWTTVLYDGLRTVDGAYNLYTFAVPRDMDSGLLTLPGQSAHNKGMAVDTMMIEWSGKEVDMGGHFDHLDMSTNGRTYTGDKISEAAKRHRIVREAAFLRAAFSLGFLIAPLRNEFWDDRLPENREDLWRVLDSAARCIGITLLTEEDEILRKQDRQAFAQKWESWSYEQFLERWKETFRGHEDRLKDMIGVTKPPKEEKIEFYHGNYHPLYDDDIRASGKYLTDGRIFV